MRRAIGSVTVNALFSAFLVFTSLPASAQDNTRWYDTGLFADWGGRDIASAIGSNPRYKVKNRQLCDSTTVGTVVTCWTAADNHKGYPDVGADNTDISSGQNDPSIDWCAYKDASINWFRQPDGAAPKGRVYVCVNTIPR